MAVTQAGQSLPNPIPPAASANTRGKAAVSRSLLGKTLQLPRSQRWSQDQCALGLLQMGPGIASLWQCWLSLCPPRCLRSAAIASCMDSPGLFHELRHSEDLEGNSLTWLSQVMVGGDYSECCQHLQVISLSVQAHRLRSKPRGQRWLRRSFSKYCSLWKVTVITTIAIFLCPPLKREPETVQF